jgi:hypothetical protein
LQDGKHHRDRDDRAAAASQENGKGGWQRNLSCAILS